MINPSPLRGIACIGSAYFDRSRLAEVEFRPLAEIKQQFAELTSTPESKAKLRLEFEGLLANAERAVPQGKRAEFARGFRWYFEQNPSAALEMIGNMPTNKL